MPERFFTENKDKIVFGTYLPFGLGPRNCIGEGGHNIILYLLVVRLGELIFFFFIEFRLDYCGMFSF